jgi:hypothetical protein
MVLESCLTEQLPLFNRGHCFAGTCPEGQCICGYLGAVLGTLSGMTVDEANDSVHTLQRIALTKVLQEYHKPPEVCSTSDFFSIRTVFSSVTSTLHKSLTGCSMCSTVCAHWMR